MLTIDFIDRAYAAEVLRISRTSTSVAELIESLLWKHWEMETVSADDGAPVDLFHGHVASRVPFHRVMRAASASGGGQIPRTQDIRGNVHYLYDVLVAQRERHVVVGVPFHGLATEFFIKVDTKLAGSRTLYEILDIGKLIVELGVGGTLASKGGGGEQTQIGITRCHLAYEDPQERRRDVEQVRLSGANLGATEIYQQLIDPVLRPQRSRLRVTPVLLGFASFFGGVRRSSATTDRHGNFKVWVSPGLRQIYRLFSLLDAVEALRDVASATSNIPILQSTTLEEVE